MESDWPPFTRPGEKRKTRAQQGLELLRIVLFPLWAFPGIVAVAFSALFFTQCAVYLYGHRHVPDPEVLLVAVGLGLASFAICSLTKVLAR